jgi:hypothetical protein
MTDSLPCPSGGVGLALRVSRPARSAVALT